MKKTISLLFLLILSSSVIGSKFENQQYKNGNYAAVISKLEPNVNRLNVKQTLQLAHSYYKMKDYFKSKILYYQVKKKRELPDLHKIALADILLSTQMIELSQNMLASCKDKSSTSYTQLIRKVDWAKNNENFLSQGETSKVETPTVSAKSNLTSYYTKVITRIQLDRKNLVTTENIANYKILPDLDYAACLHSNSKNEKNLVRNPFFITKENTLYYAAVLKHGPSNKRANLGLSLYQSTVDKNAGSKIICLPFCVPGANYISPFMSGKKLYFASDKPGGFGGYDLYSVELKSNSQWGDPVNLGSQVNGSGNEMYPTLIEGRLYFSSDGHPGFGGIDIFCALPEGINFGTPMNLGKGINSGYDDYSLMKTENRQYYFISNRDNLKGFDEVYKAENFEDNVLADNGTSRH